MLNSLISRLVQWLQPIRLNPGFYPLGYSPGLDGLRGAIMLGVLLSHLRETWVTGASVLMDAFFMLSAYLITAVLVRNWQRNGAIDWRRFYVRRVLRLLPAFYVMLIVHTLVAWVLYADPAAHWKEALTAGIYITNWTRAMEWPAPGLLGHTWSLSIEEQFYLFWPVLLALLLRTAGLGWRTIFGLVLAALAAVFWRAWLVFEGASISRLYNGTDTRADALLLGCALGLTLSLPGMRDRTWVLRWAARWATPAALMLLVGALILHWQWRGLYAGCSSLLLLPTMNLIAALVLPVHSWAHRVLQARPLVLTGRISYGLYLWHWPVFCTLREGLGLSLLGVMAVGVPLSFLLAILSYMIIERPFLVIKDRMHDPKAIQ